MTNVLSPGGICNPSKIAIPSSLSSSISLIGIPSLYKTAMSPLVIGVPLSLSVKLTLMVTLFVTLFNISSTIDALRYSTLIGKTAELPLYVVLPV